MKTVYQPENVLEAQVLTHYLKQFDIESFIDGASTREAFGDVIGMGPISLSVSNERYDEAKLLLDQWAEDQSKDRKKEINKNSTEKISLIVISLSILAAVALSFFMLSLL